MEALALDLCDSPNPAHMLVGWSSIRMPRVYGRRDASNDTRFRRLRVESGSHWSSRQGRAPYPSSGYPAFFAHLVLVARLSLIQLKVNPPKRVSRSCQGKVYGFRGSGWINGAPGSYPKTGVVSGLATIPELARRKAS